MTSDEASTTPAGEVLEARLEDARMSIGRRRARKALAYLLSSVSLGAGDDVAPGLDLVVNRMDTGAQVLRVRAGHFEEAGFLLEQTRRDLAAMSVEEFLRSWSTFDDDPPPESIT
ncbi:hypothetical protein [Microbacterium sp. P05]|uniref:hypothetical protein n=1 Tax=Microbacterium sp. P05 TaxID=3366948 RepID=UPI003745236E